MSPAQKRVIMEFCRGEFDQQVEFIRTRFDIDDFNPILCMTARSSVVSRGGVDCDGNLFILVGIWEIFEIFGTTDEELFLEYKFIQSDPVIGNKSLNWKAYLARTISHELAHTLTVLSPDNIGTRDQVLPHFPHRLTSDRRDHGLFWQAVYREIVTGFVNQRRYDVSVMYPAVELETSKIRKHGREYIVYLYEGDPVAWIIRKEGVIWKCQSDFRQPTKTALRNLREVKQTICNGTY